MSNPTIVNSNSAANGGSTPSDHSRKTSVTIGANGVSGYPPNGAPVAPSSSKPNIVFGQNPGNSPGQANASASSLGAPQSDLRVTEPTSSPSPIPPRPNQQSGGPPSGFHSQSSSVNFGSMDNRQQPFAGQHLRRDSSQSGPGEMGTPMANTPSRGGYMGGRGGRGYQQQQNFHNQMPYASPGQGYRAMANQPRPGNVPPHFQQGYQQHPNSPHHQPRSPGLGSNPSTPQMHHMQMANQQGMSYGQPYGPYSQQLNTPQQGYNAMQQQYDPGYGYYGSPYQMPPQHMQYSRSPQPYPQQVPPTARQQYMQNQYNQPASQSMSRTPSQMSASDRPPSSVGGGSQAAPPSMTSQPPQPSHTPSQSVGSATAPSSFTIPSRAKKSIVIKDNDGNVLNFDKKSSPAPPAAVKSPSPASSTPAPTPPPPAATVSHIRNESKTGKTNEEIRAEFLEKVKQGQTSDKRSGDTKSSAIKEDDEDKDSKTASETAVEPTAAETAKTEEPAAVPAAEETVTEEKPEEEDDEEEQKRRAAEELEREIAEMEAAEREEEEREKAFAEKKKKEAEEKKKREQEQAANADEEMKRLEREAEAAEEEREKKKKGEEEEADEGKSLFASLKKPTLGPGAESQSGTATPNSEDSSAAPSSAPAPQAPAGKAPTSDKPKPGPLKLETKPAEPAQPTPGMKALRLARALKFDDSIEYPDGIEAPTTASGKEKRAAYDKAFLAQFMDRFKEKPTIDWESRLKETIGDPTDSAAPKSGRTPSTAMGGRAPSGRGPPAQAFNPMGSFGATNRPLRPGTTSQERFEASNRGGMQNPLGPFVQGRGAPFPMGNMGSIQMGRSGSSQNLAHGQSPRGGPSHRGRAESGRGQRVPSRKEQDQMNKSMPLTANLDLKPLQASGSGWKPTSLARPTAVGPGVVAPGADPSGHLSPELVQRKVKGNLNKMTPERFDKISDQILAIAQQSKDETDGRTLRQVIALTFEKACDEMHWASMYAKFCQRMLEGIGPEVRDDNVKDKQGNATVGGQLFRKYLLNRCQEEFEHGWSLPSSEKKEGENEAQETQMLSEEYYKEAAIKRKGLGLVKFIGELYKLGMLSTRIMHQCVHKLLDFEGMPEESSIESLTQFLGTVGGMMEASDAKNAEMMKAYFERIEKIMNMPDLPSRMRFMLMDLIDLRRGGWRTKDGVKGPKTIQEIHQEEAAKQMQAAAEAERQRQSQRGGGGRPPAGRGDARQFSGNAPPVDYARNQVATDDLRKLSSMKSARTTSSGPGKSLGPSSMFASRSSSGRGNLAGNSLLNRGDESSGSSRAPSQRAEKKEEDSGSKNAFQALASLDADGGDGTPASSPPVTKAQPAIASEIKPTEPPPSSDA